MPGQFNDANNVSLEGVGGTDSTVYFIDDLRVRKYASPEPFAFIPDATPPTVLSVTPTNGATDVSMQTGLTATFSKGMNSTTINATTFELRDVSNNLVPAVVSYNAATHSANLQPNSVLSSLNSYVATIKGGDSGVKDVSGNAMTEDFQWLFTTGVYSCPCSIWSSSYTPPATLYLGSTALELGVKFRSDVAGQITAIRFYKSSGNTSNTRHAHLWASSGGPPLATATFSETSSGWQQVSLSPPVAISANTTYIASYDTDGNFDYTGPNFFGTQGVNSPPLYALPDLTGDRNGVAGVGKGVFPTLSYGNNYWVDVVFSPNFTQNEYTLNVVSAHGTPTKTPDQATYLYGDVVTLGMTAVDPGWTFTGWTPALPDNEITITGNTTVTANFTQNEYTLNVVSAHGTPTKTPDQATYLYGDVVTLGMTAVDPGWTFTGWTPALPDNEITITGNTTVTANFTQNEYTLNVVSADGTPTKTPDQATYLYGDVVTLGMTAVDPGWTFTGWTPALPDNEITITGNTTVTANFTQNEYTLNVVSAHGTPTKTPDQATYLYGDVVTLGMTAVDPGWTFTGWTPALPDNEITITGNTTVTANFTQNEYTLNVVSAAWHAHEDA